MTTTTQPLTIPAKGLEFTAGDVTLVAFPHPQAGYLIQGRRNGVHAPDLCSRHNMEWDAKQAWARTIARVEAEQATAEIEAPAAQPVKLAPAAKGTQTKVSDPGHTALAIAQLTGRVERGGKLGQAPIGVLNALAKRGHLKLTYQAGRSDLRRVVTGGVITGPGRTRLAQLTTAEREEADKAARLAVIDTIRIAA